MKNKKGKMWSLWTHLGFRSSLVEGFEKIFETLVWNCAIRHCWCLSKTLKCSAFLLLYWRLFMSRIMEIGQFGRLLSMRQPSAVLTASAGGGFQANEESDKGAQLSQGPTLIGRLIQCKMVLVGSSWRIHFYTEYNRIMIFGQF